MAGLAGTARRPCGGAGAPRPPRAAAAAVRRRCRLVETGRAAPASSSGASRTELAGVASASRRRRADGSRRRSRPFEDGSAEEPLPAPAAGRQTGRRPARPSAAGRAKPRRRRRRPPRPPAAGGKVWVQVASLSSRDEANALTARLVEARLPRRPADGLRPEGKGLPGPRRPLPDGGRSGPGRHAARASRRRSGSPGSSRRASERARPRLRAPEWIRERKLRLADLHAVKQPSCARTASTRCARRRAAPTAASASRAARRRFSCSATSARAPAASATSPTGRPRAGGPDRALRACAPPSEAMGLQFVVLTSVDRDDLPDGGAAHFAADDRGACAPLDPGAGHRGADAGFPGPLRLAARRRRGGPDVFNHNVETVPRLYTTGAARRAARPVARAARGGEDPGPGPDDEVRPHARPRRARGGGPGAARDDCGRPRVDIVTIGQYLRPSRGEPAGRRVRRVRTSSSATGSSGRASASATSSPAPSCARRIGPRKLLAASAGA